jgi:ubiquinone/menaquinone biosynthesis C-methylase UbiE
MADLAGLLRCPRCGSADLDGDGPFACPGCGTTYEVAAGFPVLTVPRPAGGDARERIAAYYDRTAPDYELSHGIGRPGGGWSIANKYVPFLARHLGPRDIVLEIGTGTGKLIVELRRMTARVIASDIAPGMLRWAREHGRLEAAVVADAERLPFRDGVFDAVVAMNALSYCVDKDAALGEARRVLKPGGRLLLIDMNYLLHLPYLLLGLKEWRKARLWTGQLLESTPWGWKRRLRAAGFRIEEAFEFNWVPHRFSEAAVRRWMAPADRVLSRIPVLRRCAMRIGIAAVTP